MKQKNRAVPHRDLPPKVSERASEAEQSPVRHPDWLQRVVGRAAPRHDARTLVSRLSGEARRLREEVGRLGRRLTA